MVQWTCDCRLNASSFPGRDNRKINQWTAIVRSLRSIKVVKINFVHFELFPNNLVNILAEDCPPVDSGYIPVKDSFATFPPISSNIMIHLYENPDHADISKLLTSRIPKKLDSELQICPIKRYGHGWGLELVDGLNWKKVWVVGFIGLVLSCAFGILWSVLRHDVQGGLGHYSMYDDDYSLLHWRST